LGDSGDTIIIPAGATIQNSGTATGFGATGAVSWDTTPKTTTVTAVSGTGYFVNTTSGAITVNLPAGVAGAIVAVSDYANTAATNNITIDPNGTDKINGTNENAKITTNGASVTLLYIDSTRGWKDINDATLDVTGLPPFVAATGGTVLTCGNYKTHVFTGPGTFTVTSAGSPTGSNSVEYLVVAGGGGSRITPAAGNSGGGAGGFRQNYPSPATAGLPVTAQAYPITVGAGGAGTPSSSAFASSGGNSIFSTITSAGGGGGRGGGAPTGPGQSGGSGSGGSQGPTPTTGWPGGAGNTPPVSPPQGNNGGAGFDGISVSNNGGGGGGAGGVGSNSSCLVAGPGGVGSPIATAFFGPTSPSYGTPGPASGRYFAGGGGGATDAPGTQGTGGAGGGGNGTNAPTGGQNGTANTGGGAGGSAPVGGGSGIVVIRYKFQ
jgi:hypothetical protein